MSELEPLVLRDVDSESLIQWEREISRSGPGTIEDHTFAEWNSTWRPESMQHYLSLGWCFGFRDKQANWLGYFLAQPILFFRGMTQTLWVERVQAREPAVAQSLIELAVRVAKDKRMQKVVFFGLQGYDEVLQQWPTAKNCGEFWEIKATRF
ncbi:MAG: hypothetical protein H6624_17810 [Bdellovibrionaceae bacterium]|nr:hypothetical protein [Bdellovibrionales bacterium]MCB9086201.1 hypothetical protein [Pseudobdellovibrionaceae bacterium]